MPSFWTEGEPGQEATNLLIKRGVQDRDQRIEWQAVGGKNKPLYIGTAPPGTATSAAVWQIDRYTFVTGPNTIDAVPTFIETRVGSWDNRAALAW